MRRRSGDDCNIEVQCLLFGYLTALLILLRLAFGGAERRQFEMRKAADPLPAADVLTGAICRAGQRPDELEVGLDLRLHPRLCTASWDAVDVDLEVTEVVRSWTDNVGGRKGDFSL